MTEPSPLPISEEAIRQLLDGTTPGPWRTTVTNKWSANVMTTDVGVVVASGIKAKDVALIAASPDLAATALALHADNRRAIYERDDARRNEARANGRLVQWKAALGDRSEMAVELTELRSLVREVYRWVEESGEERNTPRENPAVWCIAPLESAERVVTIGLHLLGEKFPHLSKEELADGR